MTTLAGQIVMIVRAGTTPQRAVRDAIAVIGREEDTRLVLNHASISGPLRDYYGYTYGAGYGSSAEATELDKGE